MTENQHLVIMGVAGCGKSTVAEIIADRLGWPSAEADDFHPAANIAKMSAGVPLTDDDRWPWLAAIRDWMTEQDDAGSPSVITCSALRRSYRDVLRQARGRVRFVHLDGSFEMIGSRLAAREGHFMPTGLLPSQFQILEPLANDEDGVAVPLADTPVKVAENALGALGLTLTPST